MEKPKVIRIGPIEYRIVEVEDLRGDDGGELLGQYSMGECELRISTAQAPASQAATLLHEILHGIMYHAGMKDHDEGLIDALAYGLLGLLRDNPALPALVRR